MIKKFDEYVNELWSKGIRRSKTEDTRAEDMFGLDKPEYEIFKNLKDFLPGGRLDLSPLKKSRLNVNAIECDVEEFMTLIDEFDANMSACGCETIESGLVEKCLNRGWGVISVVRDNYARTLPVVNIFLKDDDTDKFRIISIQMDNHMEIVMTSYLKCISTSFLNKKLYRHYLVPGRVIEVFFETLGLN